MHPHLENILAEGLGLLDRRKHRDQRVLIDHAVRTGALVRILPNIYGPPAGASSLLVRARAACLADPDAVVTGLAAGVIGGWKELPQPDLIDIAVKRIHGAWPGFRQERREVPRRLTRRAECIRITTFPMTALDLAIAEGPRRIDDALRRGIELAKMREALALTPRRRGSAALRRELDLARDEPWSRLECAAHELLRTHGITGWRANRAILAGEGDVVGYGDLVFEELLLVIELDGREFHSKDGHAQRDKKRDRRFHRLGWEVLRLEGDLVFETPAEFVAVVGDIVRSRYRWGRPAPRALDR